MEQNFIRVYYQNIEAMDAAILKIFQINER